MAVLILARWSTPDFGLDHGADVHQGWGLYCNGPTALARAIEKQEVDIARLLLERGGPVDNIESGLAGVQEVWASMTEDELQHVEVVSRVSDVDSDTCMSLRFEDGVSEGWLNNIQLRRRDAALANDGSGRPLKARG